MLKFARFGYMTTCIYINPNEIAAMCEHMENSVIHTEIVLKSGYKHHIKKTPEEVLQKLQEMDYDDNLNNQQDQYPTYKNDECDEDDEDSEDNEDTDGWGNNNKHNWNYHTG